MGIARRGQAVLCALLLAASCGGGGGARDPGGHPDAGTDAFEILFFDTEMADPGRPDLPGPDAAPDAPDGVADAPGRDAAPDAAPDAPADLPPDAPPRCTDGDQCESGFCVADPAAPGRTCAPPCDDGACPSGWSCRTLDGDGGAAVHACLPGTDWCKPCQRDLDCRPEGLPVRDRCIFLSDAAGSACGLDCLQGEACPEGTACADVPGTGGAARQCLPVDGTCACDPAWRDAETPCFRENGLGRCKGLRACRDGVETPCSAAEAVPEACNVADDDCDGAVDEDFLDGGLYLQDNHCGDCDRSCAGAYPNGLAACRLQFGAAVCVFLRCADGFVLEEGTCVRDGAEDCGPCRVDGDCHAGLACVTLGAGAFCLRPCDPAAPACPGDLACLSVAGGAAPACVRADGGCAAPGSPCLGDGDCDDLDACTADTCTAGRCAYAPLDCRDGNDCTLDACFPDTGCSHAWLAEGDPCSDEDSCTVGDACHSGRCVPGVVAPCDDAQPCTDDLCRDGVCLHLANDLYLPCYDGPPGTMGVGTCQGGVRKCVGGQPSELCVGQVVPVVPESCDGRDDGCSGVTDIGCEIVGVDLRPSAGSAAGSLGIAVGRMEAAVGAGPGLTSGSTEAGFQFTQGFFVP
jgi:hypothetical protein